MHPRMRACVRVVVCVFWTKEALHAARLAAWKQGLREESASCLHCWVKHRRGLSNDFLRDRPDLVPSDERRERVLVVAVRALDELHLHSAATSTRRLRMLAVALRAQLLACKCVASAAGAVAVPVGDIGVVSVAACVTGVVSVAACAIG
eukprot:2653303-Pleurochrysis_carterae.AAC.4